MESSDHVKNGAKLKSQTSRATNNIIKHGKRKNNFLEELSFKDISNWSFICHFEFCSFSCIQAHVGYDCDKILCNRRKRNRKSSAEFFYECATCIGVSDSFSCHCFALDGKKSQIELTDIIVVHSQNTAANNNRFVSCRGIHRRNF